ncbi:hypothetical protein GCAAIG_00290 [Candidatus Electronema halotolerans]
MNQKIGKKLQEWLVDEAEDAPAETVLETLHRKLCKRIKFCFNTEKRIEEKIKNWLTVEEQENSADFICIIEESFFKTRKIIAATSHRIVLFEYSLSGTLKDKSDKIWRQLVSVHLQEKIPYSSLELCFFQFHDSIFYHNPNQFSDKPKMKHWRLDELNKKKARIFYAFLKNKEIAMKEARRQEHLDNKIVGGMGGMARPGGGGPPPGGGK